MCWVVCCQQVKGGISLIYRLLGVLGIFEAKMMKDYLLMCEEFSSYCYPFNRLNCRNDQLSVCDSKYPEVTDSCVRSSKLIAPQ